MNTPKEPDTDGVCANGLCNHDEEAHHVSITAVGSLRYCDECDCPGTPQTSIDSSSNVNNNVNHTSFEAKALEILEDCHSTHCRVNARVPDCICNIKEVPAQLQNLINQDIIGEQWPNHCDIGFDGCDQCRNRQILNSQMYEQRKALGFGISREGDK